MQSIGLYVHIAFCRRRCHYCDFNVHVGKERLMPRYLEAIEREIESLPERLSVGSLFFGGGTPSLLSPSQVSSLIQTADTRLGLEPGAEITLEANPCDLSLEYLVGLRQAGVNRLSLGVQSFHDRHLKRLGRRHDSAEALTAIEQARAAGFSNLSLDLMYGLPDETSAEWESDLDTALTQRPEHLSLYCLTLEDGTPFGKWVAKGKLVVPSDDETASMYERAESVLEEAGYRHYELSNWARRDSESDYRGAHNLRYWHNSPYVGLGAGAHSYLDGERFWRLLDPEEYIQRVESGRTTVAESEPIGREIEIAETIFLALRLDEGLSRPGFESRFGADVVAVYPEVVRDLEASGLLLVAPERLTLTEKALFVSNEVFVRFLPR